jgi:Ni/Fe-hydrogenase subunit HybB-like protein
MSFKAWVLALSAIIAAGVFCYARQLQEGLALTGMSRDVTWGLYIAQFTFAVGIAASAVMLVLPCYLHDYKAFGRLVMVGEMVAIPAVVVCMLFVFVDLGQPARVWNVLLHPAPSSVMFWDMLSLGGYLLLNAVIAGATLSAGRRRAAPPAWLRPVILLSIPWAVSIHVVTAFLYCGLPGRTLWHSAILAPRFLASAFAAGPALLILIWMALRKEAGQALGKLTQIVAYAMALNVLFTLFEIFTASYSGIPEEAGHLGWMWTSAVLGIASLALLVRSEARAVACGFVFLSLWADKGFAMVVTGFAPAAYWPTAPEIAIAAGIWAIGMLLATVLIRFTLRVRGEIT